MTRRRFHRGAKSIWLLCFLALSSSGTISQADVTIHQSPDVIDPMRVSVAAKQAELGNDAERLFGYVRDYIRDDLYRGVLRGAQGTLISEAGNSLDKAILLAELLTKAGYAVRFAQGTLDAPGAEALLAAAFQLNTRPPGPASAASSETKALATSVQKRVQEQYDLIGKLLSAAGQKFPTDPAASRASLIEETRTHYWVQYQQGGSWIDLDPSFPQSTVGRRYTEASETFEAVPEELFHRVTVRVVLETQEANQRARRTLLAYSAKAHELSGQSVILTHQLGSWTKPKRMSELASGFSAAASALADALGGFGAPRPSKPAYEDSAKPVLVVAGEHREGDAFAIRHPLNEGPGDPSLAASAISESIQFEFRSPTGDVETTERMIFDRVGFAARQQGRGEIRSTPLGIEHPLAAIFCLSFYTGPLTNPVMLLKSDVSQTDQVPSEQNMALFAMTSGLKAMNHAVSLLLDRSALPLTVKGEPVLYAFAGPRLIISSLRRTSDYARLSIDLRRSQYRPLALTGAMLDKSFQLQIVRGVLDGVIESQVMDLVIASADPADQTVAPDAYSTSRVFREGARQGVAPKLLRRAEEWAPTPASDPAARVSQALANGNLVVLQDTIKIGDKERTAWWQIDPSTGRTIAVTEEGLHEGAVEYQVLEYQKPGGQIAWIEIYQEGRLIQKVYGALEAVNRLIQIVGQYETTVIQLLE